MNVDSSRAILAWFAVAAVIVFVGGCWLARETVSVAVPRDRAPHQGFVKALDRELDRLKALHEGHLRRLALLDSVSDRFDYGKACETIVGIRQVSVLHQPSNTRDYHLNLSEVPDRELLVPGLDKEVSVLGRENVLLSLASEATGGWIDEPGKPLMYWHRHEPNVVVVFMIDPISVQDAINGWLADWLQESFAPVMVTGGSDRVEGPEGTTLAAAGKVTSTLPDALLTLPTRYGSWRLASWNRVQSDVRYRLPIVLGASFLAFTLMLLGCLAFLQQRKAIRLAEQRVSFVNQVSHELRSPLTNILLNTDLACDSLNGSHPQVTQRLGLVQQEAGRLNRLIENVLSFSAIERGDYTGQAIPSSPDAVIEEVLNQFAPALERKGIAVHFDRGCPERVLLDSDAVSQILANLISNVEKYAVNGKWLGIQSSMSDGQWRIRVSDKGPGIRSRDRARIFESFQRLDSSLTEGVSGAGLGLSIARSLAKQLGGELEMITMEGGACFELRLPATQVERASV